jgi:hypothetical protein
MADRRDTEEIITCEEHGEVINNERCEPCHAAGGHDSQCRYMGAGLWDCGQTDQH